MLLPRFLTTLVGVPLLVLSLWWGSLPFLVLIFGLIMLALYEYYNLLEIASLPIFKIPGLVLGSLFFIGIILTGGSLVWRESHPLQSFLLPAFSALTIVLYFLLALFKRKIENLFAALAFMWFGNFYVVWSLTHLYLLRDLKPNGLALTLFLFIVIWTLDIGAYLGGVKFGKRKMAEKISPKKSWEGSLMGSFCAILTAWIFQKSYPLFSQIYLAIGFTALIIVVAQLSDLSQSLLKRNVGVKDSGTLLPGHGGILDRFDSFLLTAPLYYYLLVLCGVK